MARRDATGGVPQRRAPKTSRGQFPSRVQVYARSGRPATWMIPRLDLDPVPGVTYVVDTCVGLAVAHCGVLDRFLDLYGPQLACLDDVELEAKRLSARQVHDVHGRAVRGAARTFLDVIPDLTVVGLDVAETAAVEELRAELAFERRYPRRPGNDSGDRGEAASIRVGELLRDKGYVTVLLTNDGCALKVAQNHGLACRTIVGVLTQLVRNGRLSEVEAYARYLVSTQVSELRPELQPRGPEDFA